MTPNGRGATPPFELGPFRVEPGLDRLVGPAGEVALEPRAMDLLVCLARHAPETVSKEQLLEEVWRGAFVVESVVSKSVFALRQALGDDAAAPRFVLTVPRRGYRLVMPVRAIADGGPPLSQPAMGEPAGPTRLPGARAPGDSGPARRHRALLWIGGAGVVAALLVGLVRPRAQATAPASIRRLVVAPFEPLGGASATAAIAAALRAETVSELVRFARPRVQLLEPAAVAARGAFATAAEAGADALLLGTVDATAERVRIELQLVDARRRDVLWTASFERPPAELIRLRRAIADAVAVRLGALASPPATGGASAEPEIAGDVYRDFLEARYRWSSRDHDELARARDLFATVTARAPGFGEGFAWLALADVTTANYLGLDPVGSLAAADVAARRAVELAPDDPVAHAAAGLVAVNRRLDLAAGIAEYRRAVALAPSFAIARQYLAEALAVTGDFAAAVDSADEAVALEPLSPVMHGVRGLVLHAAGREREAIEAFDRTLVLEPKFFWVDLYRAHALLRAGDRAAATRAFLAAAERPGEEPAALAALGEALARDPDRGYWKWWRVRLEVVRERGYRLRPSQLAEALAGSGETDAALAELERAYAAGDGEYFLYARWSPAFDALRDDPRFRAMYARYGL
jgi:DNA-binding winged helix-turn-helix (wHTH) protein/TolB-like protein/Tfp pilus assembly protein PilF